MAAESPRRMSKTSGKVVRPQPVSDKTVMESVVDFIHDVVPQAYSGSNKSDERDVITWAKFEYTDINDISLSVDGHHNGNMPPLLLVLGYTNGVQIWTIPANSEAQEVLSWRQGPVSCLRVLPTPELSANSQDNFENRRPLVAVCDTSSPGQQFCAVNFISLKTGDQAHCIKFKSPVCDINCNKRVVVVSFQERIAVFDSCTFKDRFTVTSCYPAPGPNLNPVALGQQWLAYADLKLVSVHQTCGGVTGDGVQSYTATVIHAAKTLTKGLTMFSETVASSLSGVKQQAMNNRKDTMSLDAPQPGIVTIVDVLNVGGGEVVNLHEDREGVGIVAHFPAHASDPIAAMQFDPSGVLLLTADRTGHNFHVFRILPHPASSSLAAVHHLYTLYRGDTSAKVLDITFSLDSRWVAVSTLRGTTHIFPITPYGGQISVRTHCSPRVVNRLSRFHKSAGLEDISPSATGRNSPILSGSPVSSSSQCNRAYDSHPSVPFRNNSSLSGRMGNPRLPPYPHPTVVSPLAQIRHATPFSGFTGQGPRSPPAKSGSTFMRSNVVGNAGGGVGSGCAGSGGGGGSGGGVGHHGASSHVSGSGSSSKDSVGVVAAFAPSRAWLVGSPSVTKEKSDKRPVDSFFVFSCHGTLVEYALEPKQAAGIQKTSEDASIELEVQPRAQWPLNRSLLSPDVKPPLPSTNPLMVTQEMMLASRGDFGGKHGGVATYHPFRNQSENLICQSSEDLYECWVSQVEINTYAGPHRRLWMGPQFTFKSFQQPTNTTVLSGPSSGTYDNSTACIDVFTEEVDLQSYGSRTAKSNPMAMPGNRQSGPLLIEAGSGSFEQSPGLLEVYGSWPEVPVVGTGCTSLSSSAALTGSGRPADGEQPLLEDQLRERLADAMLESPIRDVTLGLVATATTTCATIANPRPDVTDLLQRSTEELSCSSSGSGGHVSDSRASPPHHSTDSLLVFPNDSGSS